MKVPGLRHVGDALIIAAAALVVLAAFSGLVWLAAWIGVQARGLPDWLVVAVSAVSAVAVLTYIEYDISRQRGG